jgi:large conductance mechanosensitive channel
MSIVKEFKDFINKGNVVDLAVAVVLGTAFGDIVKKIVDGIIMPAVTPFMPSGDWQKWTVGKLQIGSVLGATVNFLIISFVIFLVVQKVMKAKKKPEAPGAPPPAPDDVVLLREIRDLLAKQQR